MSSMNTELSPKNKPYDEEVWLEEATSEDLEEAANVEREHEDSYDRAFTLQFTIRPPTPPKNTLKYCSTIGDGKFEYISNHNDREMFINAWHAISQTNLWDFVSEPIDSFMWSNDPRIEVISEKMVELGYNGHSGISFGSTMRNMQYLAQHGENKFKKMFDGTHDTEEVVEDRDKELDPYPVEDAMEYEQRLKQLIKRRLETGYYEKRREEREKKLLDYMGGY